MEPLPGTAFLSEARLIEFSFHAVQADLNPILQEMVVDDLSTPTILSFVGNNLSHYRFW